MQILKNKFLQLGVVFLTCLVTLSPAALAGAANNSAERNIKDLSLQFARYSDLPNYAALNWAEAHTTGTAYLNPYRNALLGKYDYMNASVAEFVPGIFDILRKKTSTYQLENITFNSRQTKATSIVRKTAIYRYNFTGVVRESIFKLKIWLVKLKNEWKISDYYLLLVSNKENGIPAPTPQQHFGVNFYDGIGNTFPK